MYDIEKEKREAIDAGNRALRSLRTARENLNSAKNWGLVDMFGGGFFSTMLKHSKMDQAKENMEQAKYDLRNFSRELNDVNMACNLNINTGDFLSFADYFFSFFSFNKVKISSNLVSIVLYTLYSIWNSSNKSPRLASRKTCTMLSAIAPDAVDGETPSPK